MHSPRNAPGNVDIDKPPAKSTPGEVEIPSDPGEHWLVWNAGVLGGAGPSSTDTAAGWKTSGAASVSAETSVHFGASNTTHDNHDFFFPPGSGLTGGLNLGWTLATKDRVSTDAGYVELELSKGLIFSLAGGWAFDVGRTLSGPQATASVGPLYVRSTSMLGVGTAVEVGLVLKLPIITAAWSR